LPGSPPGEGRQHVDEGVGAYDDATVIPATHRVAVDEHRASTVENRSFRARRAAARASARVAAGICSSATPAASLAAAQ
jgi:hypothetical protein